MDKKLPMCKEKGSMHDILPNNVAVNKLNDSVHNRSDSYPSHYKQDKQCYGKSRAAICIGAHTQETTLTDAKRALEEQHVTSLKSQNRKLIALRLAEESEETYNSLNESTSKLIDPSMIKPDQAKRSDNKSCVKVSEQRIGIENHHSPAIPSVIVSDLTACEETSSPQVNNLCSNGQAAELCMDSGQTKSTRNPKIQNICESSGSLDSNNGDLLLGFSSDHMLVSPRRSCDSAYSSSMDAGSNAHSDEASVSCSIMESDDGQGMDNEFSSTVTFPSRNDSPSHKFSGSNLSVHMLRKNMSSPFSSSSSLASEKGDESSSNTLSLNFENLPRKLSSSSSCSLRSSLSFEESEEDFASSDENSTMTRRHSKVKAQNSWTKIRRMVIWSPFMQSFKKKYPWVQLAGHAGNFQPGEEGCILKKYVEREAECLNGLTSSSDLQGLAPTFHGVVEMHGEKYTRMQDLLLPFDCPSLMDCKMGIRTYLEDELVKAKVRPKLRKDMYLKMVDVSPNEPSDEERNLGAVTKPRYMQWREHISSTSNLGFRIEGIKKSDKDPSKDYKMTKTAEQVTDAFKYFIDNDVAVLKKYISRLKSMCASLGKSDFFHSHEVIGSSLLFVHDPTGAANVWMIDFGKTTRLPNSQKLDHRTEWQEGNREDGYLFGMDNMIQLFEAILQELQKEVPQNSTKIVPNSRSPEVSTWSPGSGRKALRRQDARTSSGDLVVDKNASDASAKRTS